MLYSHRIIKLLSQLHSTDCVHFGIVSRRDIVVTTKLTTLELFPLLIFAKDTVVQNAPFVIPTSTDSFFVLRTH